jgi:hypothetical protein
LVILAAALITTAAAGSHGMASPHYQIPWSVLGMGGGSMSSQNYLVTGTLSQAATGRSESGSYAMDAGFWPGYLELISLFPRYNYYFPLLWPNRSTH